MTRINRRPDFQFNLLSELTLKNKSYKTLSTNKLTINTQAVLLPGSKKKKKANIFSEIRSFWQYLMIVWIWVVYNFSYYGFQFAIIMSNNFMVYFVLLSLSEFFGNYIQATVNSVKYMLSVAAICCVLVSLIGEGIFSTFLFLIAKFMMSFFSGILLSYTMQLFPTSYRAQGYSLCTLISKVAVIFMPAILTWFNNRYHLNPLFFIGILLSTGSVLSLCLIRTEEDANAEYASIDKNHLEEDLI